jgi:sialate O-acetylesterase
MPTLRVLLLLTTLLGSLAHAGIPATIALDSPVFQDHMVLQRDRTLPIWGTGQPVGNEVTVSIAGQTKMTTVGPDGKWRGERAAMPAGGPHRRVVGGGTSSVIGAVVVGDHLTGRLPTDDGGQPMVVLPSPSR